MMVGRYEITLVLLCGMGVTRAGEEVVRLFERNG